MKTWKLLLLLFFSMASDRLWGQTDSTVQWKLVKPTKVFKLMGVYWQRNGNNYMANTGNVYYGRHMNFEFMQKLFDEKTVNASIANDRATAVFENSNPSFLYFDQNTYYTILDEVKSQTSSGLGFNLSYDLLFKRDSRWAKEVRVGGFYQKQHSGGYYKNFLFPEPSLSGMMSSSYFYQYTVQGVMFNADFLMNRAIIKNSVAVYGGVGVRLFPEIFSNLKFDNTQYFRVHDTTQNIGYEDYVTASADSNILYPADRRSAFNLKYGVGAIVGVKFNISCSTNFFLEYQRSLMWDTFFGFKTVPFQTSGIFIGVRKKLNFIKEEGGEEEESSPPRPFY